MSPSYSSSYHVIHLGLALVKYELFCICGCHIYHMWLLMCEHHFSYGNPSYWKIKTDSEII